MKKFTFSSSPAVSKNLSKVDVHIQKETNFPSILLLLPPIFFSLNALLYIVFNLNQKELLMAKTIGLFLHLLLIMSFFIVKNYNMSKMAQNTAFLFVRTCHLIVFMETEDWKGDLGQLNIVINGIKLSYLEFVFFFLFNSPKFFMISLISNFVYIGIRVPFQFFFDYFHLLLLIFAIFSTILILEKDKRIKSFFFQRTKIIKRSKEFISFKTFFNRFPDNTIDLFMEGLEEGVALLDDEFGVIKQNDNFKNLLKKIAKDNPMGTLFGAGITALKEGTEDLKSWYYEKDNFTISFSKCDTVIRNKNFSQNSFLTLFNLLTRVFPMQAPFLSNFLKNFSVSPQPTINYKNLQNQELLKKMQANELKIRVELFFPNETSSLRLELLLIPIYTSSSLRFLFVLKDITQNYKLNDMMLQSANKTKAVSFVSHEMRTPLNCIIGMLNMMEPLMETINIEEFLLPALSSAKFLLNLLNDLLDVAQIQAGTFKLVLVEFELKKLLLDVLSMIEIQAKAKGLLIFLNYDDSIPVLIKSDPNRLRQIITNLLGNALKFTQKGSISLKVDLDVFDNSMIHLFVIDNGIGIKEENKKLLFTAFGKVENGENEYLNSQGVGLGLLISNKLAISVGPSISKLENSKSLLNPGLNVFSEFGKGATFRFILEDRNEGLLRSLTSEMCISEKLDELKLSQYDPRLMTHLKDSPSPFLTTHQNLNLPNEASLQITLSDEDSPKMIKMQKSKISVNFLSILTSKKDETKFQEENFALKKEDKDKESNIWFNPCRISRAMRNSFYEQKSMSRYKDEAPKIIDGCTNGCPAFLVCDDDPFNIKVLQNFLRVHGLPIDTAYHGDNAIEKVKKRWEDECCKSFKLIFMDIEMPQKNGLEAAQEIILFWKEKGELGCPIVATTGHVEENEEKKILQSGMRERISKPINHRDLRELVEKLLVKQC